MGATVVRVQFLTPWFLIFVCNFLGRSFTKYFSEITTSLFVSISAAFSIILFWNGIQNNTYGNFKIFEWISSGNFAANWSINIDPLSSVMLVVVTFVSALAVSYTHLTLPTNREV